MVGTVKIIFFLLKKQFEFLLPKCRVEEKRNFFVWLKILTLKKKKKTHRKEFWSMKRKESWVGSFSRLLRLRYVHDVDRHKMRVLRHVKTYSGIHNCDGALFVFLAISIKPHHPTPTRLFFLLFLITAVLVCLIRYLTPIQAAGWESLQSVYKENGHLHTQ